MKIILESKRLRVVFAGTPQFAVPALGALVQDPRCELVAVYTQPDRAAGRGQKTLASPVKDYALAHGLPVLQPLSLRDPGALDTLAALSPDLVVVAAYGLILPRRMLEIPTYGALNVHASLLPRWRGAAPIQRSIMAGDTETGITIMRMVEALDAGPMLLRRSTAIGIDESGGALAERLATIGASALVAVLDAACGAGITEEEQPVEGATYARKIERTDRLLHWTDDAASLARRIRALNPAPLAMVELAGLTVNVWTAEASAAASPAEPGTVIAATADGIAVATGQGVIRLTALQPPGKRRMSAREFLNGYRRYFGG